MKVENILLIVSLIILFGYIAEWIFEKRGIPDTLFLIILGFLLGPNVLNYIKPESLGDIAPLFTTFTLLFLLFNGALSIDLKSLAQGIGSGFSIGIFSFLLSSIAVSGLFFLVTWDIMNALMLGFALGGVSSAFIIPIIGQLKIKKKLYSVLTLESALTDVISIVFAITMIELQIMKAIEIKSVLSQVAALFSIAGIIAVLAGYLWIFFEKKAIGDKNYFMTIAHVMLVYFLTEYLGGNGAIAALIFGIVLTNSKTLVFIGKKIMHPRKKTLMTPEERKEQKAIVSKREKMFYREIAFFLKTFFFVYIGLLLNVRNLKAVLLGTAIALSIMLLRSLVSCLTKGYEKIERVLINSLFARGIAPAAIILTAVEKGVIKDQIIIDIVYFVITATIILSSVKVFIYKTRIKKIDSETS
ncbi:MAG: cation:proton antiporter [Candidatus Aminicenantes bacterium]|nr:cation:proton antiporter [Candidatus Aminicenantes bacterium]